MGVLPGFQVLAVMGALPGFQVYAAKEALPAAWVSRAVVPGLVRRPGSGGGRAVWLYS